MQRLLQLPQAKILMTLQQSLTKIIAEAGRTLPGCCLKSLCLKSFGGFLLMQMVGKTYELSDCLHHIKYDLIAYGVLEACSGLSRRSCRQSL